MNTAHRYALYFCPPEPWGTIGRSWLGRCENTGQTLLRSADTDTQIQAWTQAPRRYGLHATLKAPWRLRAGATPDQLDTAVRALAARQSTFDIQIKLQRLRGFLAWCIDPDQDPETSGRLAMDLFAGQTVSALDDLRALPTDDELARRRPESLNPSEQTMLARWGYPYAFDTFKFHITLTGHLHTTALSEAATLFEQACRSPATALPARMPVHTLSVYVQPVANADFIVARHYGFDGTTVDGAGSRYLPS